MQVSRESAGKSTFHRKDRTMTMYAQIKKGKLVRLTDEMESGAALLKKKEIDGVYAVESLEEVSQLLKNAAPTSEDMFATVEHLMGWATEAIDRGAERLRSECQSSELQEHIETLKAQARDAGGAILKGVRDTMAAARKAAADAKETRTKREQ
jgi:hypothetical protein